MKRISVLAWIFFCFLNFSEARIISDSLVDNLDCNSLSVGNIMSKIRPEAFSSNHHIQIRNWSFHSKVANLAVCWGLSSTQRKFFYLQRLNDNRPPLDTGKVFDMIRGAQIVASPRIREYYLENYNVFPVTNINSFVDGLVRGGRFPAGSVLIPRNFQREVERSQELHFFRVGNISMGAGSGPLSPRKNLQTAQILLNNLRQNRLTLINLRVRSRFQHIVVAKSIQQDPQGNLTIQVYDSNSPYGDQMVYFDRRSGHFYAQQIMGDPNAVGVFVVDEKERSDIENSLLKHYQIACRQ